MRGTIATCAVLLAAACGEPGAETARPARVEVVVFAATSLRDALQEIAPGFERAQGARVVFSFGSSGDLARQIVAADRADAFVSADEREMDRVAAAGRIDAATRRTLLANRLVVVAPADTAQSHFPAPFDPAQLTGERVVRLSLANVETVPAGRYARAWLGARGIWGSVEQRVVPAVDVRAALAAVESGACQAGIVYRTDAARSTRARVVGEVPEREGPAIRYAAACVTGGRATELGRAFVAHLAGDAARAAFERHGFVVLSRDGGSER